MKRILFFTICCIVALNLYSQRATDELPNGLVEATRSPIQSTEYLTSPDLSRIIQEDLENDTKPMPLRFAVPVWVNYNTQNSGVWQQLEDGGKIWRLKVNIPGALGTITYYDQFWLPKGGKFWVYSEDSRQYIGAIISDFIESSKEEPIEFATAIIYGDNVVYEYYQPPTVNENPTAIQEEKRLVA